MLFGAMAAFTARPNSMAGSTAPLFITGSVPGSARSTAQACVLGSAPKAVGARLKIFDCVDSWACVSKPITTSQPWMSFAVISIPLRLSKVEIGRLLEAVSGVQQLAFGEVVAEQLQAHGHVARAETAGDAHARQAGE